LIQIEKITVRNTLASDTKKIEELQKTSFPDLTETSLWKKEHIDNHLRIFPEGQLCVEYDGQVVGSSSSFITQLPSEYHSHTWLDVCGDFSFKNHNPNGDTLYGADMSVHPKFQKLGIATKMIELRKQLVIRLNLRRILSGSRINGYANYSDVLSPSEYVKKVEYGNIVDPVLSFHLKNELKFIKILPNYLNDKSSNNYGVLVEWKHPKFLKNPA
jgi:GNAT superfamily N-acetyltransferase